MLRISAVIAGLVILAALTVMPNSGYSLVGDAMAAPKTTNIKSNNSKAPKKATPTPTSTPAPVSETTSTSTPAPTSTAQPTLTPTPTAAPQASPTPAIVRVPAQSDWALIGTVLAPVPGTWEHHIWGGSPGPAIKVGNTYYLYYVGADGYDNVEHTPTNRAIGVATSTDGKTFTKYAGNPIVTYSTRSDWKEESATNPVVMYDNGTWHMWYAAGRGINASEVDLDIRYRTSANGLDWTGDTLVYRDTGSEEYTPINAIKLGSTYYLYYLGPLSGGKGALRVMSGTNPKTLTGTTQMAAGPFRSANGLDDLGDGSMVMHLMDGNTGGRVLAHPINKAAPTTLGTKVRDYTFSGYARHSILLDGDRWLMYQLDISGGASDGHVILRTTR